MSLEMLTLVLGWTTLVNFTLLVVATVILTLFRQPIMAMHRRLLDVDDASLKLLYVYYLSAWKVLVIVFAFTPWITLKIMGY